MENKGQRKRWKTESGIQPLLYPGIHGRGIQNPWKWNPESTEVESGIHSVESRIQGSLGLPYMGRAIALHSDYLIGQRGACASSPFRAYQQGKLSLSSLLISYSGPSWVSFRVLRKKYSYARYFKGKHNKLYIVGKVSKRRFRKKY